MGSVSFGDWLLALHLLSAAALVGGSTLFSVLIVALWKVDRPAPTLAYMRLSRLGGILIGAASALVLIFGVWLAFDRDDYHVWDGWILAAIVLWIVGVGAGQRAGVLYARVVEIARTALERGDDGPDEAIAGALRDRQPLVLHVVSAGAIVLILLDMIFKPGA
jgi:uncharacterized membrane protein